MTWSATDPGVEPRLRPGPAGLAGFVLGRLAVRPGRGGVPVGRFAEALEDVPVIESELEPGIGHLRGPRLGDPAVGEESVRVPGDADVVDGVGGIGRERRSIRRAGAAVRCRRRWRIRRPLAGSCVGRGGLVAVWCRGRRGVRSLGHVLGRPVGDPDVCQGRPGVGVASQRGIAGASSGRRARGGVAFRPSFL